VGCSLIENRAKASASNATVSQSATQSLRQASWALLGTSLCAEALLHTGLGAAPLGRLWPESSRAAVQLLPWQRQRAPGKLVATVAGAPTLYARGSSLICLHCAPPRSADVASAAAGDFEEVPFADTVVQQPGVRRGPDEAKEYLVEALGLTPPQLAKVAKFWAGRSEDFVPPVGKCAQVVEFLLGEEVRLPRQEVTNVIASCPEILDVFSPEVLREKVRFLLEEARVRDDDLAAVLMGYPQVFGRSITTTLRPALEFWIGAMGVPLEEMTVLLRNMPAQVWCKPETMRPKWKFAQEVMSLNYQDIIGLETPFFRLSLDKTIAPRHFFLLRKNISGLPVEAVLGKSNKVFCRNSAKCDLAEYETWLREEWPVTEEARSIAWVRPSSAAPPLGRSRLSQDRREERPHRWPPVPPGGQPSTAPAPLPPPAQRRDIAGPDFVEPVVGRVEPDPRRHSRRRFWRFGRNRSWRPTPGLPREDRRQPRDWQIEEEEERGGTGFW